MIRARRAAQTSNRKQPDGSFAGLCTNLGTHSWAPLPLLACAHMWGYTKQGLLQGS